MTEASKVLVAMRVRAPAERAFAAFTEQIAEWWRPDGLFEFTKGKSGTLVFEPGPSGRLLERYSDGTEFVIGCVRVWSPPRRIVVGWRQSGFTAEQNTELRIRFDEVVGQPVQTRVTVEHVGWDRIPPENVTRHGFPLAVFQLRFAEWWQRQLTVFDATFATPDAQAKASTGGQEHTRLRSP